MNEMQNIFAGNDVKVRLEEYFVANNIKNILLVCDQSIAFLDWDVYFHTLQDRQEIRVTRFSDFQPNPVFESVSRGVLTFKKNDCEAIVAIGGGSAIDVAKCIKLFEKQKQVSITGPIEPNDWPLIAIPTTAGSGSEATPFAVIYHENEKYSIMHKTALPAVAVLDPSVLLTLPAYQKKSTMMDALCHCIESIWSKRANDQSRIFAQEGIRLILANYKQYLNNEHDSDLFMLQASYLAGKAISITTTTACHAMSYKMTTLFSIAHGHAVALCMSKLWPYMVRQYDYSQDASLVSAFQAINEAFNKETSEESISEFEQIMKELQFEKRFTNDPKEIQVLAKSVNVERLQNHPIALDEDTIAMLYQQILSDQ